VILSYRLFKPLFALGVSFTLAAVLRASPSLPQNNPASVSIRVPILGFLFDAQTRGIRSLFGGPEASMLSEPLELGAFKQIDAARRNNFGLAIIEGTNQPVVIDFTAQSNQIHAVPDLPSDADLFALSPSGVSAAVYYSNAGAVKGIKDLPYKAAVIRTGYLGTGQVRGLAISDDGATILADVNDGAVDSIVTISAEGDARRLFSPSGRAQITFLNNSHDSIVVDQGSGNVYLLRDPAISGELMPLPGVKESIGSTVGTGLSYDNKYVFFAASETGMVARFELATGWITVTSCACTPDGLWSLNRNSLFRLNGLSGGLIWIYDATQHDPATYVLPLHSNDAAGANHEQ
jgi:hypothetical protein